MAYKPLNRHQRPERFVKGETYRLRAAKDFTACFGTKDGNIEFKGGQEFVGVFVIQTANEPFRACFHVEEFDDDVFFGQDEIRVVTDKNSAGVVDEETK